MNAGDLGKKKQRPYWIAAMDQQQQKKRLANI